MTMKILIIENPRPLTVEHFNDVANAPLSASLNSGYALAVARTAGWETAYLDFTAHSGTVEDMAHVILAEKSDLILFHWVYSWGHESIIREILELLHRECPAPLGAFGLFPTLSRQQLLHYASHLDFILVGEFEETLSNLLPSIAENGSLTTLDGIVTQNGRFEPRTLISDLTSLPVPDDVGANRAYRSLNIAASRGCHGECSFCFIHRFYGCSSRRTRTVASLAQELEIRLARRAIDNLYFIDPTFIGQGAKERERVMEISRLVRSLGLPFGFETRVDSIDPQLVANLAKNGASSIFLGIESGCDTVLQRIGKRISTAQIRRSVQILRENGIQPTIGFIMFEPDTSLDELRENYTFLEKLELLDEHTLTANLLYHNQIVLNGSPSWERFEREGRLQRDKNLPFEASYLFRDQRVEQVCRAMGRLSGGYFQRMDNLRHNGASSISPGGVSETTDFDNDEVNFLLKEAFLAFCSVAESKQSGRMNHLEESYYLQLQNIFSNYQ
jgi:radical SAM superfamily enzyme YgiQ (UPF0313 family)